MIIIKQETGTNYFFTNGTRIITVTGLQTGLTKTAFRNVEIIRAGVSIFILYPSRNNWTVADNGNGSYTLDYSALSTVTALATGDELVIKVIKDSGYSLWEAIKTVVDNIYTYITGTLVNKVDSVQMSVNALSPVSLSRTVTVNEGSIAFFYINQPVTINTATVTAGLITEIRLINASGFESVVTLPITTNPGMSIKVYTNNAVPFSCTISGSKTTDSATSTQNITLATNPYPGFPYVGSCIWDAENTQMFIVQAGSSGINVGLYDNNGKILQEFESRFGALNNFSTNGTQLKQAVNTPGFYYIGTTTGIIWYNKTTKAFGLHTTGGGITVFHGLDYIPSKLCVVAIGLLSNVASLIKIDVVTNISTTIALTDASATSIRSFVFSSYLDRLIFFGQGSYHLINLNTNVEVSKTGGLGTTPFCALSEDGTKAYFPLIAGQTAYRLDLATFSITSFTVALTSNSLRGIIVKSGYIYVFSTAGSVWKGVESTLAQSTIINGAGFHSVLLEIGTKIWGVNCLGSGNGRVNYLDYSNDSIGSQVVTNDTPVLVTLHPQTGQIYVGCNNNQNGLSVVTP